MAIAYVQRPALVEPQPSGDAPTTTAPVPVPAPTVPVPAAASTPSDGTRAASGRAIAVGFGIVAVGGVLAWLADRLLDPSPFKVGSDLSVFAALFVASAAIERLLEPFSRFFGKVEDM